MRTKLSAIAFILVAIEIGAQNVPMVAFDQSTGDLLAPNATNFLRRNVVNQRGIIRQVDTVSDLNGTGSPYRSGEHVFVIDAGTFGNGGAALFTHDAGSSDPTNTTDTVIATPGRWKVRSVYSTAAVWSTITGTPSTLSGYGITNALPLSAGSNAPLTGPLYLPGIVLGTNATITNWTAILDWSLLSGKPTNVAASGILDAFPITAGTNKPLAGILDAPFGIKLGTNALVTNWPSSSGGAGVTTVNGSGSHSNIADSAHTSVTGSNGTMRITITDTTGLGPFVRAENPSISGTWQFDGLSANVFQATNLNVATNSIGTMMVGSATITNALTASNITATTSALFASQTNTGTAGFGGPVLVGTTNIAQKLSNLEDLMVFTIMMGSELLPTTLTTNATRFVPARKGVNWESTTDYNRGYVTIPVKCELVRAVWDLRNAVSSSPTGSNIVWYVRVNNTTDTAIHTNAVFDTSFYSTNSGAISVSLSAGDTLAIKYATPAWLSTAPQPGGPVMLYFKPRL